MSQNITHAGRTVPVMPVRPVLLFLAAVALGFGALSLILGQDANWDLRNYHWYNAHAFLTGRWAVDVAPSQIPAFYNPTLDIPFYLLTEALPARVVGFLMGVVHGLNIVPLFGLAWAVLPIAVARHRMLAAAALAGLGLIGGGHVGMVGTTFYDNVISLFVLGAAWLVAARAQEIFHGGPRRAFALVGIAGFLVGAAAGLKQPSVVFAVGFCFAFLLSEGGFWRRMFLAFFFGIGVLAGIALFSAHWMLFLWREYENPLFPYFNDVLRSPLASPDSYRDEKWQPKSAVEAALFPFLWTLDPLRVGEIAFRDLRVPVAYAVLLMTGVLWVVGRARGRPLGFSPAQRYVLAGACLSYLAWVKLFAIYRYLIPLELVAPIVIALAISAWPLPRRARLAIVAALGVALAATGKAGTWGRVPWTDRFIEVQAPELPRPDETIVLMTGYAPTSFLIAGFPPQVPFLRVQSYLLHPDQGDTGLNRRLRSRIAAHRGDFFLLVAPWELWTIEGVLHAYDLTADPSRCVPLVSNLDEPMRFCPVDRR